MSGRKGIVLVAAGLMAAAGFSGCQDTAKNSVHVRQPAQAPQRTAPTTAPVSVGELPVPQNLPDLSGLAERPRPWVDSLIDEVQGTFNAAQQAYQAGQLDVARKDFNAAIARLTKSNLEATGDARLQDLFNRIVDTMQADEMATEAKDEATAEANEDAADAEDNGNAAASDDTTAQTPPESTAPIEEIANMENLPASDPRLAATAEKELITVAHDLPLTVNPSVLQYLSFFASPRGREIVATGLERAGRYRAMIESTLKKEGLPLDLIYLAQAESAFKPRAVSSMGARGIWQFMPYSGELYGLHRTYWVDQRDNPEAATEAAAETLRDLYQTFGDWYLAMAAYNSGPMNVARAVERTGYADFWELQRRNALPAQTKDYVPIILALTLVAKDPGLYGIHVDADPDPGSDTVEFDHSINLRLVSDAIGASSDDLQMLNPELVRGITPPSFALKVPKGTGEQLKAAIAGIPADKLTSWRLAKFDQGETLSGLARQYHVTLASLENVNMIDAHDPPAVGTMLMIPAAPPRVRLVHYRVRRGDTLDGIASRYNVSVAELQRWNHLRTARAPRGRLLRINENSYPSETATAAPRSATRPQTAVRTVAGHEAAGRALEHRVKSGETLWSIAKLYGTTVEALKQSNPFLATRELEVGDRLSISPR